MNIHSVKAGSPAFSNPINLGTLGPKISRSNNPILGDLDELCVVRRDRARFAILAKPTSMSAYEAG